MLKLWQNEETKIFGWAVNKPYKGWNEIPAIYEEQLPSNISNEKYTAWLNASIEIDGKKRGPALAYLKEYRSIKYAPDI